MIMRCPWLKCNIILAHFVLCILSYFVFWVEERNAVFCFSDECCCILSYSNMKGRWEIKTKEALVIMQLVWCILGSILWTFFKCHKKILQKQPMVQSKTNLYFIDKQTINSIFCFISIKLRRVRHCIKIQWGLPAVFVYIFCRCVHFT